MVTNVNHLLLRTAQRRAGARPSAQNVFCEVSKYTRATHPHVRGVSGRTRIKQEFRQTPARIDYRFPPRWGLPAERTAQVHPGLGR